jgi:hypothetical protein
MTLARAMGERPTVYDPNPPGTTSTTRNEEGRGIMKAISFAYPID